MKDVVSNSPSAFEKCEKFKEKKKKPAPTESSGTTGDDFGDEGFDDFDFE